MLKRYFYVKIYPALYLSYKPILGLTILFAMLLWLGVYFGFFRAPLLSSDTHEAVPANTAFLLEIKNPENFKAKINSLEYLENLNSIDAFRIWQSEIGQLDSLFNGDKKLKLNLKKSELLSCLSLNGEDFVWTYLLAFSSKYKIQKLAAESGMTLQHSSNFLKSEIFEFKHPKYGSWAMAQSRGLLMMSRHVSFIEAALVSLNNVGNNLPFDSRFKAIQNTDTDFALYANLELSPIFLSLFGTEASLATEPILRDFSWSGGALSFEKNNIVLGGKLTFKGNNNYWKWLSNQKNKAEQDFLKLIPENFAFLRFQQCSNFDSYYRETGSKADDFRKYILPWLGAEAVFLITEPTDNSFASDKFFMLKSKDSTQSRKLLENFGSTYGVLENKKVRNYSINKIAAADLLAPIFGKDPGRQDYYCLQIDDFVIFAASLTVLETWIENYHSGKTLEKSLKYKSFSAQLRQPAAAAYLINTASSLPFLKLFSNDSSDKVWEEKFPLLQQFGPIAIQLNSLGYNSFSLTMTIAFDAGSDKSAATNLLWRCKLQADALSKPALVINSDSRHPEIMIQDREKRLYLISRSGEHIWQKPLDAKVLSEFIQIDYYGNGQLYYTFNTERSIYILDKNGDILKQIALPAKASNGMSVFIHDKELRFYVSCNNAKVYGYDKNGKPLPGWNPNTNTGTLNFPIQYYEIGNKKFMICMNSKGKLHLAKRNGDPYKTLFLDGYFNEGIFIDSLKNRMYACAINGKISVVDFDGKKTGIPGTKDINKDVSFFAADISADEALDFARLSKKRLTVHGYDKEKKLRELMSFSYKSEQSEIFPVKMSLKDKTYIGSFNAVAGELNLLSPEGILLSGFPLKSDHSFLFSENFSENGNTLIFSRGTTLSAIKIK